MNMTNTAMLVTFLTSLATVPAASASLDQQTQAAIEDMSGPSNASGPVTHQRTVSSDGVTETIETEEGTITFRMGDGFSARYETPMYVVRLERDRGESVHSFESSAVGYTTRQNLTGTFTRCRTAEGWFVRSRTAQESTSSFEGQDRSRARSMCDDTRRSLSADIRRITRQALRVGILPPSVSITAVNDTRESITFQSDLPVTVSMDGWELADESGNTYELSGDLPAEESVTVLSGDAAVNCTGRCWERNVWNDGGDTAIIRDADGRKLAWSATGG